MNQRERAMEKVEALAARMATVEAEVKDDLSTLEDILSEAQNDPPEGQRDGSLDERTWTQLRTVARDLRLGLMQITSVATKAPK